MEAIGKFDFTATGNDELSFRKGDVIKILGTKDNWYRAERHGQQGFVPRNYITLDIPSWYQEDMSRRESENTLMPQPIGSFIIRGSQSSPGNISISVRHEADVQHFKVLQDQGGLYFLWTEKFSSLNELVNYYTLNSISKQSSIRLLSDHRGHGGLLEPIPAIIGRSAGVHPGQSLFNAAPDLRPVPQERRNRREELQSRPFFPPAEALPPPQESKYQSRPSGPPGPSFCPAETIPTKQESKYQSRPSGPPGPSFCPAETIPTKQERRNRREELQSRPLFPPAEALPPPQESKYQSRPSGPPGPSFCPAETIPTKQASPVKVKALYDFTAEEQDELNFSAGDIIDVLDQSESFWWVGRVRGRTGLFPTNYITSL